MVYFFLFRFIHLSLRIPRIWIKVNDLEDLRRFQLFSESNHSKQKKKRKEKLIKSLRKANGEKRILFPPLQNPGIQVHELRIRGEFLFSHGNK